MVTVSCWADVYACVIYTEDLRMYMCGCSSLDNPGWIMTISYGLWLRLFLLLLNVPLILKVTARRLRDLPIPRFLPTPVNVTFTKGEVAVLQCSMENLGARLVVWRKASEPNPLTIGLEPFIDNPRISVIHDKSRQHWELHIKNVQPSHAGVYECQISSKHDLIRLIMLRVNGTKDDPDIFHEDSPSKIKPSIHISGTKVVHVGQTIKLQCNVTGWVESFRAVDWFKDGDRIIPTIGNKVTISKFEVTGTNTFTSYLEIKHSKKSDSGTYLCWTSADIDVARMHVDVLNTESINKKRGGSGQAGTAAPHNGAKFGSSSYLLTFTTLLVTICRLCGS